MREHECVSDGHHLHHGDIDNDDHDDDDDDDEAVAVLKKAGG